MRLKHCPSCAGNQVQMLTGKSGNWYICGECGCAFEKARITVGNPSLLKRIKNLFRGLIGVY